VAFTGSGDAPEFDPFTFASRLAIQALFVMSPEDESPFAVSAVARAVIDRLTGPRELVEVDGGHFGIIEYPSAAFGFASEAQAEWLGRTSELANAD